VEAWRTSQGHLQATPTLTLADVAAQLRANHAVLLDVRAEQEWKQGHARGSLNVPVGDLEQRLGEIPRDRSVIVHCQTGARAAIAASLLQARGFSDVRLFPGGFAEWHAAGQPEEVETG
jgi:hydroxyacylglutathione hydrolase